MSQTETVVEKRYPHLFFESSSVYKQKGFVSLNSSHSHYHSSFKRDDVSRDHLTMLHKAKLSVRLVLHT